ncbi:MAG: zeta toxin family protein [Bacteroidales bacterium]|nr:zeta toxin family protein [Bacteroidales bacterium]
MLYVIGGCNGAGKTTASYAMLPDILECREFVNADEIAKGLSPFNPGGVTIKAGRLMISRIEELLAEEVSFSVETTLATRSYVGLVRRARSKGYRVSLLYFWLNSVELAMHRVAERVANGGHDVRGEVVCRRYYGGLRNLFDLYTPEVDFWTIYDNSESPRQLVASGGCDMVTKVYLAEVYNYMQKLCQSKR